MRHVWIGIAAALLFAAPSCCGASSESAAEAVAEEAGSVRLLAGGVPVEPATARFTDAAGTELAEVVSEGRTSFPGHAAGETVFYDIEAGGTRYKGSFEIPAADADVELIPFEKPPCGIQASPVTVGYTNPGEDLSAYLSFAEGYDGEVLFNTENVPETAGKNIQTDLFKVDGGTLFPLGTGEGDLYAFAGETDNFAGGYAVLRVTVNKANLGTPDPSCFTWTGLTKTYDGNPDIEASGTLNDGNGQKEGDTVTVSCTLRAKNAAAGDVQTTVTRMDITEGGDRYSLYMDMDNGPTARIEPKEVRIRARDVRVRYGDQSWAALRKGGYPPGMDAEDNIEVLTPLTETERRTLEDAAPFAKTYFREGSYDTGIHEGAVVLTASTPDGCALRAVKEQDGDVEVLPEATPSDAALWARVKVDEGKSRGICRSGGTVWAAPGAYLALAPADAEQLYDRVYAKLLSPARDEAYRNGLSLPVGGTVEAAFYLGKSASPSRTDADAAAPGEQDNRIPAGAVRMDASGPSVSFRDVGAYSRGFALSRAVRNPVSIRADVTDGGSGVASAEYKIVPFHDDGYEEAERAKRDPAGWAPFAGEVRTPGAEGYYLVLVRARDSVGNETIAASGGIVIDATAPSISVSGFSENTYYNADVPFTVSVADTGGQSGLSEVIVTASAGASGELAHERYAAAYTGGDALKSSTCVINGSIPAAAFNSNNVTLTVEAKDRAGNAQTETKRLAIDTTAPEVHIRYDLNTPVNGKYFSTARTATVTFRERNFDPSQALVTITAGDVRSTVPIGSISGNGITLITSGLDSESGTGDAARTDDRTITYVIAFGADGKTNEDYRMTVSCTDLAGNRSEEADYGDSNPREEFTIAQATPSVSLSLRGADGSSPPGGNSRDKPFYDRQAVRLTVDVDDENFNPDGLAVHIKGTDANGKYVDFTVRGKWSGDADIMSYAMEAVATDGHYEATATYTDLAGNSVTTDPVFFVVDRTPAECAVRIQAADAGTGSDNYFSALSWLFTKNEASVFLKAEDATSGVKSLKYMVRHPDSGAKGELAGLGAGELEKADWTDWTGGLTLPVNSQSVVYARAEDRAGNVTYVNSRDAVVVDDTAPEGPEIRIGTPQGKDGAYGADVPFTITVTDPEEGGAYAGLKRISWNASNGGKVTQEGAWDFDDRTQRKQSFTATETLAAGRNNGDTIRILVTAEDYAGNVSQNAAVVSVDTEKPKLEVSFENDPPHNGACYRGKRTAVVRVTEDHFSPDGVSIRAEGKNGASGMAGKWKSSGNIHVCKVSFDADDLYDFSVKAEDTAGNAAEKAYSARFAIDTAPPVIGVSYDNNDAGNDAGHGNYYNRPRTAVVTVREANFDEKLFRCIILDGDGKALPSAGTDGTNAVTGGHVPSFTPWIHRGNLHSRMIIFDGDGEYRPEFTCTDLAGNASGKLSPGTFTIDRTAPDVSFSGIEDKSAVKEAPQFRVLFRDAHFDKESVHVTLKGRRHGEAEAEGSVSEEGGYAVFTAEPLPDGRGYDDLYTVTAKGADLAGNTAESSVSFSLNRYGSVYTFDHATEKALEAYYLQKIGNVVIHETNLDGLENRGVTLARNGEAKKLAEDEYRAEKSVEEGWTVWTYTLPSALFKKEGLYEILIDSVDGAGNRQDNALKEKPIRFVIDRTPPSVVLAGIEDGAEYDEVRHEFTVRVSDNTAMGGVELLADGETVCKWDAGAVRGAGGVMEAVLEEKDARQAVQAKARDAAGNEAESRMYTVTIRPSPWTRLRSSPALPAAGAALAAVPAAIYALKKRRKKRQPAGARGPGGGKTDRRRFE